MWGESAAQTPKLVYLYDNAGRLAAVVDPAGQTARYTYDAVGNILSIVRTPSTQVTIVSVTPGCASAGQSVSIYGTGFSPTASQNTVNFGNGCNAVPATVTSATANKLTVTVPASATTGVAVTTPNGSATSSTAFSVACGPPTITGFSPNIGVPGTQVTVTGTNFSTEPFSNNVAINGIGAIVGSSVATSLVATVAPGGTSGRISVATAAGYAVSTGDFFVPPPPSPHRTSRSPGESRWDRAFR